MNNDKGSEITAIVGIGASAGGLEALQQFLEGVGDIRGYAYIVCQHLSPTHRSHLADLLSKSTTLKVKEAQHGQVLKADEILICPPKKNIRVDEERVILSDDESLNYITRPSIDVFFESLSLVHRGHAVGVILSGTGTDGARGIRAIKAEGGVSIAQQPETAKYNGMPNAAIASGHVDLVMTASEMVTEINDIFMMGAGRPGILDDSPDTSNTLDNIIFLLKKHKHVDFSLYKDNSIRRRIERRMTSKKFSDLEHYKEFLERDPTELQSLFDDILIHVTEFFREPAAYKSLQKHLIEYLKKSSQMHFRVWVAGCSTGEEAYSIAITLNEILGADINRYTIQIFASDIDTTSVAVARLGRYSQAALANVSSKLRKKYFSIVDDDYRVNAKIREMCIFSVQDLINDPPFSNVDLLTCRNTLIYFKPELQRELLQKFHYVLKRNGIMMLGKSENVSSLSKVTFQELDKTNKIFTVGELPKRRLPFEAVTQRYTYVEPTPQPKMTEVMQELMTQRIEEFILPNCVVINSNMDLIYSKGHNPYIICQQGERSDNIFLNLNNELSVELRAAILESENMSKPVKTVLRSIEIFGLTRYVRLYVMPFERESSKLFLICFQEEDKSFFDAMITLEGGNASDQQLKAELDRTRTHMQAMVEELEANNEEMQSLNEELQSANEELQSSNEELETTNEELQSTNEELHTAYAEMQTAYSSKQKEAAEHLNTRKELQLNSERLELALKASGLGFCQMHLPTQEDDIWSTRFAEMLGYAKGELPHDKRLMLKWLHGHILAEQLENYVIQFERFARGDDVELEVQYQVRNSSEQLLWFKQLSRAVKRDRDGRVLLLISTFQDVTNEMNHTIEVENLNRRLAELVETQETVIKEQSLRLDDIVGQLKIGIWSWSQEAKEMQLSPWLDKLLKGHEFSKLSEFIALFEPQSDVRLDSMVEELASGIRRQIRLRVRLRDSDHGQTWFLFYCRVIEEAGLDRQISGFLVDTTREAMRENLLEQLVQHNRLMQEMFSIGVYEYDPAKQLYWRSESYCQLLGFDPMHQTLVTRDKFLGSLQSDQERAQYLAHIDKLADGESHEMRFKMAQANGQVVEILDKSSRVGDQIHGVVQLLKEG